MMREHGSAIGTARLILQRYTDEGRQLVGHLLFLPPEPFMTRDTITSGVALLTNGIGGMARVQIDLGSIGSKMTACWVQIYIRVFLVIAMCSLNDYDYGLMPTVLFPHSTVTTAASSLPRARVDRKKKALWTAAL